MGGSKLPLATVRALARALIPLVTVVVPIFTTGFWGSAAGAAVAQVHVQGTVHCHGGSVTGIWINDSAGGGWATRYDFTPSDTSDDRYGMTVPAGTISFSVGCGGTTSKWGTVNNSPSVNLASLKIPTNSQLLPPGWTAAYTVNLFCGNGAATGPCNFPSAKGKTNGSVNPAGPSNSCQCTYAALNWWEEYEGIYPLWAGDAGTWGGTGPGTPYANGWTRTSIPMADSIVVFPDFGTGAMAEGHVGWVTGLIPGANHTVAGIYVDQGNVKGDARCSSGDTQYSTPFYFSDYPAGKAFPPASSWMYIVAPNAT